MAQRRRGSRKHWTDEEYSDDELQHDPEEWLIPSRDSNGGQETLHVRITPLMAKQISIDVQSTRFPYKTNSDLIRHAIWRHLGWLAQFEEGKAKHFLSGLDLMMEVVRDDIVQEQMRETFDAAMERAERAEQKGDMDTCQRLLVRCRQQLRQTADCRWKKQALERFRFRFAGMLQASSRKMLPPPDGEDNDD